MGNPISESGDFTREKQLIAQDDRGVFGAEGMSIPAGLRRQLRLVGSPVRSSAWQLMNAGKLDEAEKLFQGALPRNETDKADDRYFGIYWGLAEVAVRRDDKIAALDWFQQGIRQFPSAVRRNHIRRLLALGVQVSHIVDGQGELQLDETHLAAILTRIAETTKRWTEVLGVAPIEEMHMAQAQRSLETKTPLGRWAASRRNRA